MKKFTKKIIYFLIPVFLFFLLIILIDPYDLFNHSLGFDKKDKNAITKNLNIRLKKIIEFKKTPCENILLGDSRIGLINVNTIKKITNNNYYNFSYGAASISEIIDTFWYANEICNLKKVYIGINFNLYNSYNNRNLVKSAIDRTRTLNYIVSRDNFKAIYYLIVNRFSSKVDISKPKVSKDNFWIHQLNSSGEKYYNLYKYPLKDFIELKRVTEYCTKNNISISFIIPPTHIDLQNLVKKYSLENQEIKFKSDLNNLAKTYDYDFPCEFTSDRNNFNDPFHIKGNLWGTFLPEIFNPKSEIKSANN